ncbi:MAG TPA: response regulator transcription factor [Burkholderiales bacterium]
MNNDATVFVVDDDAAVRDSLRWMIESAGLKVETYASAEEFLAAYDPERPGCLVLDMRMPGMGGIALQKHLASRNIDLAIIFITAHASVPTAVHAMRAGAVDFIPKPFSEEALLDRITQCIEEARRRHARKLERAGLAARFALLTPREHEILQDVVAGKPNKVIAAERGISQKTVEAHRAKMMQKLQARSLADLMRMVLPRHDLREKP